MSCAIITNKDGVEERWVGDHSEVTGLGAERIEILLAQAPADLEFLSKFNF